jgi:hypothetical protein
MFNSSLFSSYDLKGLRFLFTDGSRVVFRLSGTGSVGATIRMYLEQYQGERGKVGGSGVEGLAKLVECALDFAKFKVCVVFFLFLFLHNFWGFVGVHWSI